MPLTRPKAAQVNFDVTNLSDPLIRLNSGQSGSNDKDTGIVLERGSDTNVALMWDESADRFVAITTTEDGTTNGDVTISSYTDIQANAFYGDGSNLTGITSGLFTAITDGGQLTSTESGSAAGPIIELDRNSASPFNADYLGQLKFKGRNSTDQTVIYSKISAKASDVTDGSEDGTLEFTVMNNGSQDNIVRINENGLYINAGATLKFEGTTGNTSETTVTVTDPTADRTITFPDATGTVVLADTTDTLTNKTLTTPDVNTSLKMISSGQLQFRDNQSYITENGGILLFNGAAGRGVRMYSAGTERVAVSYDGNLELKTGVDIVFEGATSNDFETTLTVTDPTADRTITLPDTSGTVALTSDITTNSISQGDSSLAVTDSGTGVATLVLDNATHTTFNSSGITLASGVFSGTATSAQYADLAEMYAGDKNYEVGTVVCVGGTKEVTECDAYADSKLAGVVSDKPAYLMNRDIDAEYPICVGFVGRVPVKVVGHIEKGDLLTTSEVKGFATKFSQGSYNPGCIIGISLNDKKDPGEGIVEVLLKRS